MSTSKMTEVSGLISWRKDLKVRYGLVRGRVTFLNITWKIGTKVGKYNFYLYKILLREAVENMLEK